MVELWPLKKKQRKCSVVLRTFQQYYQSVLGEWPIFCKPVMISHYLVAAVGNILSMWMGSDLTGQQLKLVMDVGDLMGELSWQPFHFTHCFFPSNYDTTTKFLLCIISDSLLKGKLKRLKWEWIHDVIWLELIHSVDNVICSLDNVIYIYNNFNIHVFKMYSK